MTRANASVALWVCAAVIFVAAALAGTRVGAESGPPRNAVHATLSSTQAKAPAQTPAAPAEKATYVGTDACKTCHTDIYDSYEKTPHWKTMEDKRGGPSKQGCEACHGPGSAHVEGAGETPVPFDFSTMSVKQITDRCMTCHATRHEQTNFPRSVHAENGLSCLSCHSPHHFANTPKTAHFLLVKAQPELCYGCHRDVQAAFRMPWHHKVNEGLIQCSDCHNPHGSFIPTQLRTASAGDMVCFKCHEDKQGPFVFEHEPVHTEGCTDCHIPHGTPNPHLLRYANVNQLCLQCHTTSSFSGAPGTPVFHNQSTQFQACTLCHSQIHGSNFDPYFFK